MSALKAITMLRGMLTEIVDASVVDAVKYYGSPDKVTNIEAHELAELNKDIARLACYQRAKTWAESGLEDAKRTVKSQLMNMRAQFDGRPGHTTVIHDDCLFEYSIKENNKSSTRPQKDFITELRALGVSKEIVDKALVACAKDKKGNTYHMIEIK